MAATVALLNSTVITATSTGTTAAQNIPDHNAVVVQFEVTAAAAAAGDTFDMFVQTTVDGITWLDIMHFTQVLGNGGVKRFVGKVTRDVAETMYETGTALAAAAVRNVLGSQYRVRYAIVGATPNFTASVKANFI